LIVGAASGGPQVRRRGHALSKTFGIKADGRKTIRAAERRFPFLVTAIKKSRTMQIPAIARTA